MRQLTGKLKTFIKTHKNRRYNSLSNIKSYGGLLSGLVSFPVYNTITQKDTVTQTKNKTETRNIILELKDGSDKIYPKEDKKIEISVEQEIFNEFIRSGFDRFEGDFDFVLHIHDNGTFVRSLVVNIRHPLPQNVCSHQLVPFNLAKYRDIIDESTTDHIPTNIQEYPNLVFFKGPPLNNQK